MMRMLVAWVWTLGIAAAALACMPLVSAARSWQFFFRRWARGVMRIVGVRVEIENPEYLAGPAVFIANHTSMADIAFVPAILPATVQFIAKREIGRIPIAGHALVHGGGLVVDRSNPHGAVAAIRDGIRRLPAGWSVGVFPEGTRSRNDDLQPFKKGAFHVARELGLPVVPVGAFGARDVAPKGAWFGRPGTVFVAVGEPIDTTGWQLEDLSRHVAAGRSAVQACVERARERYLEVRETSA
jgi:putative phosphoserine phosphatase/1-acylglycerol-3-phosphate O-acyltransferase